MPERAADNPLVSKLVADARVEDHGMVAVQPGMSKDARRDATSMIRKQQAGLQLTDGQLGKRIGKSASVISQVLNHKYPADPDPILRDIVEALADERDRRGSPGVGSFVSTRVAEEIFSIVKHVRALSTIGVLIGPSGIGKGMALAAIVERRPASIYLEVRLDWTPTAFVKHLARAAKIHDGGTTSEIIDRLIDRLRGTYRLIVIDEAEYCNRKTLTIIRQIHDATECPVVLAGTPDLRDRIDSTRAPKHYNRVGIIHDLTARCQDGEPLYRVEDVQAFFESLKLIVHGKPVAIDRDALMWLKALANVVAENTGKGGFRVVRNVVRIAFLANRRKAEFHGVLTVGMLREANEAAVGKVVAGDLEGYIEIETRRIAAAG